MSGSDRKKRRQGSGHISPGASQSRALSDVADDFEAEVSRLESITARVARLELNGERNLERAAELLKEAADSHERFLGQLQALVEGVDRAKRRHNEAADTLAGCASHLQERRNLYQSFQERFAALAGEARAVIGLMQGAAEAATDPEGATAVDRLRAASVKLSAAADAARELGTDARQAGFGDLEREADAVRQQLQALSKKLQRAGQPPGPTNGNGHA